jgi:tetratricopeptide (TPR) repeat protein
LFIAGSVINNKGLEFEKMGNFELAIQYFSEAIMLNTIYVNAYSNRGNVYKKMSKNNIEYIENALDDFNMVLLLDPKHENTLFNRGLLFLKKEQYENAITDFSNLINISPKDSEAYSSRGQCYYRTKNFNLSIKDLDKAIEINPMYAKAYYLRSSVHKLMGNDDKAQEDLRKSLEINPRPHLENIFYKGFIYNSLKDNDEAIAAFTEAIKMDPKLSSAYFNRGRCYFEKGAYDEAILDYDTALSLNPQNIEVYKIREWALYFKKWSENHTNHIDVFMIVNRAIENMQERKYDLAFNDFEQVLKLCTDNAFVFYRRGLMYAEIDEPVKAIKDFTKTIELAPTVAAVYNARGSLYSDQEIYDRAIEDYTMAIAIYPRFSDAIFGRGIAYYSQKENKLATDDFNTVLQIDPNDDDAKDYLQRIKI